MKVKKAKDETSFINSFFSLGKRGMEMWQLVLLILLLILLLAVIAWYGFLGGEIDDLLRSLGDLL